MTRLALLAAALAALAVAGCTHPAASPPAVPGLPELRFLPPVDLVCRQDDAAAGAQTLAQGDCGAFGEPVIEVAGDGAVWASATCCVGRSPPIWVSRDGGQTFRLLPFADRTGVLRDAFGVEGDFAIDDAGNTYFFDISAATGWFTKYRADGTHVLTKADVFPPLVDRPWVRAGREDQVWIFYNTGSATNLYASADGGMTWTLTAVGFDCALMTIGQGPARDRLFVSGCPSAPQLSVSGDGGLTFGAPIRLPVPDLGVPVSQLPNGTGADSFMPPVADEAGNVYVPFTYNADRDGHRRSLWLDVVHPDGQVVGPLLLSGDLGWNEKPWGAAGRAGEFAVAWYASESPTTDGNATWNLTVAATADGASAAPRFTVAKPDPEPVLVRQGFGRQLGDFLQSDVGPDGRLYVIYARRDEAGAITNRVVVTDGWDFGPGVPRNGPRAA
jgi:hypothetical protein